MTGMTRLHGGGSTGRLSNRAWAGVVAALAVVSLTAAACGSPTSSSSSHSSSKASSSTGKPVTGGTATFALQAGAPPNYIFPLATLEYFSITNYDLFMDLMYRPLYWFGKGSEPILNPTLSLAYPPQYTDGGRKVVMKLRNYKWSDGTPVTATDIAFWQNMVTAEKANWAAYSPGEYPDNVSSFKIVNPREIVFNLTHKYSSLWFTYNELSQVTPLPPAWDKTSMSAPAGSGGCATDISKCKAVYTFLAGQAKHLATYATNPLWQVVDGPWHLTSFQTDGQTVFSPNPHYSGPNKPRLSHFKLLPFTSDSAEYSVLRAGKQIDVGYLPPQATVRKPSGLSPAQAGPNPVSGYTLVPWLGWAIKYFQYNYHNATFGPVAHQLYFRQAMQHLVDQTGVVSGPMRGYGYPTYGPVPTQPKNPYVTRDEETNLYPYSIAAAKRILKDHGWKVVPGGIDTCARPGTGPSDCGAGVKAGTRLDFSFDYWTGTTWEAEAVAAFKSAASQAGIGLILGSGPANTEAAKEVACKPSQSVCNWQIGEFYWLFAPDYYPTGDELWSTGAGSNPGSYSDHKADSLIYATYTSSSVAALKAYENYLAVNVPDLWWPQPDFQVTEVVHGLHGVVPQNPLGAITPETWYFTK